MVVMGHVLRLCMSDMGDCVPFRLIGAIHMPLFFFISGWFSYKVLPNGSIARPNLGKRFMQLMIPTFVVGGLYILAYNSLGLYRHSDTSLEWFWMAASKKGYWFTVALFEITLIYALIAPLLHKIKRAWMALCASLILSVAIIAAGKVSPILEGPFEFNPVGHYLFTFLIGVLARRHKDSFERMIHNEWVITLAFITVAGCLSVSVFDPQMSNTTMFILHIPLAMIVIRVIRTWTDASYESLQGPSTFVRLWIYLGRNSLGIYLLHYFMLFPMHNVEAWLQPMLPGFVPTTLVAILGATAIISCTCMVLEVLKPSKTLSKILTGT